MEDVIMQKISQFFLSSLMVGFFWVCTTIPAASSPDARSWGNVFRNSDVLALQINLAGYCITKKWNKYKTSGKGKVHITGIGAVVDTNYVITPRNKLRELGIRVIPYVISQKQNKPLFLIPGIPRKIAGVQKFNKFYPACTPKSNSLARGKNSIRYYPLVLLEVDDEKSRDALGAHLRELPRQNDWQHREVLEEPIEAISVRTMAELLEKVFSQKQAKFLEGLPFDVRVKLIDENQKKHVQFMAKSTTPFTTAPLQREDGDSENSDSVSEQKFDDKFDNALRVIERLKKEKSGLVIKLEQTERRLKLFETQNALLKTQLKTSQRKHKTKKVRLETKNAELNAQVNQLTKQLAAAKKLCETNPEIFRQEQEIEQLDQENTGLQRQVEILTKKLAKAKQQCSVQP